MTDSLKKYLLEDRSVRVQAVRVHDTWTEAQRHHSYPPAVKKLLGEMVAAATLLAANLKFDGSLVMQLQGDGPIALLVIECRADLTLRATAKLRQEFAVPDSGTLQSLLNPRGNGRFIVILDPKNKDAGQQPYQGIVPIQGDTVAEALEHYMTASEQLDTRLWLASDDQVCAGLLLQRLPDHGGTPGQPMDRETWSRTSHLASTIKHEELLTLDTDTLIRRIFWEETLIAFDPSPVSWHCGCSRTKVGNMLVMLGQEEIDSILEEAGEVAVDCDFCGKPYRFDAVDCAALFTNPPVLDPDAPPNIH